VNTAQLSLDQAPPYSVPLRFFFTAPLFGMAAALLLLWYGPASLASRWTPALLVVTHCMTLGFAAMGMSGALLQLLPVLVGARVARPRLFSALIHGLLTPGVLTLVLAFLGGRREVFVLALLLLVGAMLLLATVAGLALRRSTVTQPTARTLRLALLALLVTVLLGAYLALVRGAVLGAVSGLTGVHLTWGALGWIGLLVMAVAYQVVPMFQMTPEYPPLITRGLGVAVFILLVLWSLAACGRASPLWQAVQRLLGVLLMIGFTGFAAATLRLQHRRRRRLPDVTLWYWRVGMLSLLASGAWWLAGEVWPGLAAHAYYPLQLGVLMIAGFTVAVISGMLYKSVPFLGWLHLHTQLHTRAERRTRLPTLKDFIPERVARRQFHAYLLSLCLLLCAVVWPEQLIYPAALTWLLACSMLWLNLFGAVRLYRRLLKG
jgi:hypothetical protein